jgi:hypothetical protein
MMDVRVTAGVPGGCFVGASGYCPGREWGRGCGEWWGLASGGLFDRMRAGGRICNLVYRVGAGQGFIRGTTGARGGDGSGTARKDSNSLGRGRTCGTREDGDLRGWTRVDVLPPDGMQEVSGSSPLSSTWSEVKFERFEQRVQQDSTATFPPLGLLARHRIPGTEPALVSLSPGQIPPHRSGDLCRLATTPPSQRAIPASGCCRICKWSGRAGRPGRCDSLPGTAPAGQDGAFADGRRGARAQRVAPMVSARRWARWCAT